MLNAAVRTADLDELDTHELLTAARDLTALIDTANVDEPRMQAALVMSELLSRVGDAEGRRARMRENGISDMFPYSPYAGPLNPISPPVTMSLQPGEPYDEVHSRTVFEATYNGPPQSVHGGVIAGVFDELLGSVCVVNDVAGFTGTLTVKYRSPTPLGEPIDMRSWVDRVEGRKTFARGTFYSGETLLAEAEGIFIQTIEFAPIG